MTFRIAAMAAASCLMLSGVAEAQAPAAINNVDYTFIGLTYLGNKFQVDTGKLGETRASSKAVRDYAQLMDTSHVAVENNLVALLGRLHVTQPPASLLANAYKDLVRELSTQQGPSFDRDYVQGQISYQDANDALYRWEIQNGSNAELKDYARQTLVKIDDHKQRVEALAAAGE